MDNGPKKGKYEISIDRFPLAKRSHPRTFHLRHEDISKYDPGAKDTITSPRMIESVVEEYFRKRGYYAAKIGQKTLLREYRGSLRFGVVQQYLESLIDDDIQALCHAGIPDLIVYQLPQWYQLGKRLPQIHSIEVEDGEKESNLAMEICVDEVDIQDLVNDLFFVEVKRKHDQLNENQREWIRSHDEVDVRVVYIEPVDDVEDLEIRSKG